jgi:hypothetical protein
MLENTNDENITPATLSDGEVVIPKEYIEQNKEAINELVEKYKEQATAAETKNENVVSSTKEETKPGLGFVESGVMGSTQVPATKKAEPQAKPAKKADTVAIHSTRNVTWTGVGKVYRGYNIVTKEASERWLTRDHTRLATPQEVAQEFGI